MLPFGSCTFSHCGRSKGDVILEFIEQGNALKIKAEGKYLAQLDDVPNPSRLIFEAGEYLVKVDHRPAATWQSRQTARELEFYDTLQEDKQYFAQILDSGKTPRGKWWIKQKRYVPDSTATKDALLTLLALEFKYNLRDVTFSDTPPFFEEHSNWMVSGGEVIVYDWGGYTA